MTKDEARSLLKSHGLRSTGPRVAVLRVLATADRPLSYREVHDRIEEMGWDPTTIYRNLVKLRDARIAPVVTRAEGIDRYALAGADEGRHRHPHFLCEDCGLLACLPPTSCPRPPPRALGQRRPSERWCSYAVRVRTASKPEPRAQPEVEPGVHSRG